jgi:hypothetical protein
MPGPSPFSDVCRSLGRLEPGDGLDIEPTLSGDDIKRAGGGFTHSQMKRRGRSLTLLSAAYFVMFPISRQRLICLRL